MSKLSKQQKLEIYRKWKLDGYSVNSIAKDLNVYAGNLYYLVQLIDLLSSLLIALA